VDEWNPLNQPIDGHQFKYHVPGIGVAQIVGKAGVEQETLGLIEIRSLDAAEMATATAAALALDQRAYTTAKAVFTCTPRAVARPPA
ncbi:MAG TPA: hypothetical protein VEN99_12180, partial [Acidimicrobiia bacterium]|nr:hypothetical protein [Acidimicrobiia bacterium]